MRVIIYGAGAIGGVVGGYLAYSGQQVVLIGRPGHVKLINEQGLRLVTPMGTRVLRLPAFTSPEQVDFQPDDVVFLTVKGQNTEEALQNLQAVIKEIPIFCVQNGVRNEETASRYFAKVYGVMVRAGAIYLKEGEVTARNDPPGGLVIGRYPKGTDNLVNLVAANLRNAGFFVKVTPDIMPYKWGKLMSRGSLTNTITGICNAERKEIALLTGAAEKEAQELLAEANISWVSEEALEKEWPELTMPVRSRLNIEAYGSTWQSLARGAGTTETEFFNGEVVRLAKRLGRQAPINEKLLVICQQMAVNREPPGKYTPAQLSKLLGLSQSS